MTAVTEYTFDTNTFSDLHKDAYGYRPHQGWWDWLQSATDAEKQEEWDSLIDAMDRREAMRVEDEKYAVENFERLVFLTMGNGAKTRKDAVAWIMEAEMGTSFQNDVEHFEWHMGIPFGYIKKNASKE
jgi:hypothetical protein